MNELLTFGILTFTSFFTLINPLGTMPIFMTMTSQLDVADRNKTAKKASDNVFLMAMKDANPSVPKWKMYAAYYAVVLCGRWSIIPRKED